MIIPVRKVTNFANIIPMTHTVCTLYKQHLLFQTQAAMFKVQMNDKPNLALIKNEAQICKNCPLFYYDYGNTDYTPIYSRGLERKKVQAFCLLQIFFSGISST